MTFPRKTAIHHGLRVAAGVVWLFPFIDAPASARRRRNDASGTGDPFRRPGGEARAPAAKQGFDRQRKHKRRNKTWA